MKRRYGVCDSSMVDELAVEFACEGTPMNLNHDETVVLCQRLCGRVTAAEIARRARVGEREVARHLRALGAKPCPACNQLVFDTEGVLARHVNWYLQTACGMTGHRRDDTAALRLVHRDHSMQRILAAS